MTTNVKIIYRASKEDMDRMEEIAESWRADFENPSAKVVHCKTGYALSLHDGNDGGAFVKCCNCGEIQEFLTGSVTEYNCLSCNAGISSIIDNYKH